MKTGFGLIQDQQTGRPRRQQRRNPEQVAERAIRKLSGLQRSQEPMLMHSNFKAPFNIHSVFRDDKFTYIAANPDEVASFYEVKDGKPNLVQFQYQNGVYVIRDLVERGYLQVGKKRTDIARKPNG